MSTTKKIKNFYDQEITLQQAKLSDEYYTEQYEDGELKKVDYYAKNALLDGEYYLSPGEDLQTILNNFQHIWTFTTVFFDKQVTGSYVAWNWEIYKGLIKEEEGVVVFDAQGRRIVYQARDLNKPTEVKTTKTYYLENLQPQPDYIFNEYDIPDFGTLEFFFNSDNPGVTVAVNLDEFNRDLYPITDSESILNHFLIAPLFSWEDNPYYHSAEPLIPNT